MSELAEQVRLEGVRHGLGQSEIDSLTVFAECVRNAESGGVKAKWKEDPVKRLAKSLQALELQQVREAKLMADIGSGSGFPGLVLAAALPGTTATLIEEKESRCEFLSSTIEAMGLANVEVVQRESQLWPAGHGRFDLVTSRGVWPTPILMGFAQPFLKIGGTLVVWDKPGKVEAGNPESETNAAARAAALVFSEAVGSENEMQIFAFTRIDSATAAMQPRGSLDLALEPRPAKRFSKLDRKLRTSEERLRNLVGTIEALRNERLTASSDRVSTIDTELQRLETRRDSIAKRVELTKARARTVTPSGDTTDRVGRHGQRTV